MKVKELIKLLQTAEPEREVYLSRDSEGNSYQALYGFDTNAILVDGDIYDDTWTAEEAGFEDEEEWEILKQEKNRRVLVLWP